MASRVVSLWMTNSVFIKQGSDVYFEVGFLYTGHRKVCEHTICHPQRHHSTSHNNHPKIFLEIHTTDAA